MAERDFRGQLVRQLEYMENSRRLYDSGHREEAIRLAMCLRIIFHDTRTSISLLKHLNVSDIAMLSALMTHQPNQKSPHAPVRWQGTAGKADFHAVPLIDSAPSKINVFADVNSIHSTWSESSTF
jgi:hypothetical protein